MLDRLDPKTIQEGVDAARDSGVDSEVASLLEWARGFLGERLMMTTAFGKSGMVIMHALKDVAPDVPIYFIDTGFHFGETLEFFDRLLNDWKINLISHKPKVFGDDFVAEYGEKLHDRDPDLCCHKNKVEPLGELVGQEGRHQGWITGVRRDQSSTRAQAETIEILEDGMVKIQPLVHWSRADVEEYLEKHSVPLHPLFSQGYASVGCAPCTKPSGDSKDERAGRWAGKAKTECGLHTFWKKKKAAGVGGSDESQGS
ncbi:MAG: phosphoadenylyl-sulfate reductase [Planctomycetota bacterium]